MNIEAYKHLVEVSPFGFANYKIIVDEKGEPIDYIFLEVNKAFEELTGLKRLEIIGEKFTKIFPDTKNDEYDRINIYGNIALNGGQEIFEQYSASLKRWYEVRVYSPEKYFFSMVFFDIMETKSQAETLEEFFSVNLDLLCIADTDGNFIKVNKEWEFALGYSTKELEKRKFLEFVHPEDLKETLEAMSKLGKQQRVLNFTNRYKCKDGSYRFIEWRSQPKGKLIYAAARDITETKKVDMALQKSEERFRSLYANMIEGVALHKFVYNKQGIPEDYVVIEVNPSFERNLGISKDSIIGKTSRVAYGVSKPPFFDIYRQVVLTGKAFIFETFFQPLDKYFSISVYKTCEDGFATIFEDITEKKIAVKQIVSNNERLQSIVNVLQSDENCLQDFLDHALEELIKITESKIGYIYFYDEEKKEFILNSWSKNVMKECAVAEPQTIYCLDKTGLWGEAVRQQKPIINNNFEAFHPDKKGYPEGHVHLKKFLTIPVFYNKKIVAVAGVANKNKDYDQSDILKMTLLMNAVWKTTERIKADKELQESYLRYDELVKLIPIGIYSMRIQAGGKISFEYCSEKFCKLQGLNEKEVLSNPEHVFGIVHPNDQNSFRETTSLASQTFKPLRWEGRSIVFGEIRWFRIESEPTFLPNGDSLWNGVVIDITDRKLTEEALQESETKFKTIADTSPLAIYMSSGIEQKAEYINQTFFNMFGYSIDDVPTIAQWWPLAFPNEEYRNRVAEEWQSKIKKSLETFLEIEPMEVLVTTKNGQQKHIQWGFKPMGKQNWAFGLDLTERKLAEKILRESEEQHRLLFETAQEGIVIAQGNNLKYFNPMMLEITGYDYQDLYEIDFIDLIYCDDKDIVLENLKKRLKGEQIGPRYQYRIARKDKSLRWVEMSGTKFAWNGEPATLNFIIDVTDQKLAELELKKLNYELQLSKNVVEENLHLKNMMVEELSKTKTELEKINSEKDKFFSIIAHDLKNPFQGFLGMTELMAEETNSFTIKELAELSKDLHTSASNLFKLLQNLLDWAQMKKGTISYIPKELNLLNQAAQNIELINQSANLKGINIINEITDPQLVYADEKMIDSVFRNLLSNAVKFTKKGGKIIIKAKEAKNHLVEISISDNGIGMEKEQCEKLFKIDEKVGREGTAGETSTGLGLLLCKEFVEKHGGKIWVNSKENIGSSFYFTVPAIKR